MPLAALAQQHHNHACSSHLAYDCEACEAKRQMVSMSHPQPGTYATSSSMSRWSLSRNCTSAGAGRPTSHFCSSNVAASEILSAMSLSHLPSFLVSVLYPSQNLVKAVCLLRQSVLALEGRHLSRQRANDAHMHCPSRTTAACWAVGAGQYVREVDTSMSQVGLFRNSVLVLRKP